MSPEKELKEQTLNIFSVVAGLVLLIFSAVNFFYYSKELGTIELVSGLLLILNVVFYRFHKNLKTTSFLFLLILFFLFSILILTGGIKGTGIFWSLSFPFMSFFVESIHVAVAWNFLFVVNILFLHYLDSTGIVQIPYSQGILLWFIPIYTVFTAPAFIYTKLVNQNLSSIYEIAIKDFLTGVYNRAFALAFLNKAIEQFKRKEIKSVCVTYVDLDNFKFVNDMYGHATGDKVLIEAARFLEGKFRKSDVVARIGGDEFLIISTNCNRKNMEKRLQEIEREFETKFKKFNLSISFGVAVCPTDGNTAEELLETADKRMYGAKSLPSLQQPKPDCNS